MKRLTLSAVTMLIVSIAPVSAADFVVVANSAVSANEIGAEDLKLVFLGSKTQVAGSAVEPVLASSGAAHEAFLSSAVGKSDSALRNHFKTLTFTGKGSMPKSLGSDAAIVQYVAKTKGAIGYVSPGAATGDVKKLAIK